jgi:galactitol-specific phosphotransferase system IIB component
VKGRPANPNSDGVYGAVADPLVIDNFVYVLDMKNLRKQFIKKYDLESGKLIWTSPEIEDARAIPNMYEINGTIVLQVGGTVEEQGYYRRTNQDGSVSTWTEIDFIEVKPFNVQGFDAASGKSLWQSERMKKGITNLYPDGEDVIVCSGKALYRMDSKTGKEKFEVDVTKDGVSQANKILDYKDKIIVVCDKGVAIHNKADGKLVKAAKYKRAVPVDVKSNGLGTTTTGKSGINKLSGWKGVAGSEYSNIVGNSMAMQTKGGDIAVYNLDDCSFKQIDARKNADLLLTSDGNYVYVFEGGGMISKSIVTKYKTK